MSDWGPIVAVQQGELDALRRDAKRHAAAQRRWRVLALASIVTAISTLPGLWLAGQRTAGAESLFGMCDAALSRNSAALAAVATSHEQLLAATHHAPSVGTHSWGRRFEITKYVPRSEDYGRFNDGFTATMKKADPDARIVAVDPKLIPYGSRVWIEDLGWYNAEDCGVAIKGFRLDLLTATVPDAMEFGRQRRFVIVVPPSSHDGSSIPAAGMIGWPTKDGRSGQAKAPGHQAKHG